MRGPELGVPFRPRPWSPVSRGTCVLVQEQDSGSWGFVSSPRSDWVEVPDHEP